MGISLLVVTIMLFVAASAFFSASETSLFSLSPMRVRSYQSSSNERKRLIAHLLKQPRQLLVTILIANTTVNIMVQDLTSTAFGEVSSWALRVGVPLLLTLILGEILPKSVAIQDNVRLASRVAPFIYGLQKLLGPLRRVVTTVTSFVSRVLFIFLRKEEGISGEELKHMLSTSQKHGVLAQEEAELVHGYLDLQEAQIRELMRPREEMLIYDINDPLDRLIELFVDQECSRIPVCDGSVENILGVITAKRFFLHRPEVQRPSMLAPFLIRAFFVPETTPARRVMRELSARDQDLAIVVDEYGTVTGLVALEDLYEMVVGDIQDRRDVEEMYTRAGDDVIIASGKMELVEFEDLLGVSLDTPNNMVTLGGWLTEQLGDIPKSGTNYVTKEFLFHVLAADPTRVRRIYIRRIHDGGRVR